MEFLNYEQANYKQILVQLIGQYATDLNNINKLGTLKNKLMSSNLSDDLKVAINDIYIDATTHHLCRAKKEMLLILQETQNRLKDGYGLINIPYHQYYMYNQTA